MFYRNFIRIGTTVITVILIAIGVICYKDGLNPILLIFPGKVATESYHILPETVEMSDGLDAFDRVIVDGDSEATKELYERVSKEAQKLPDVFAEVFNKAGYKLVITDNIYKYTKQHIPDGFYLGGVTQEHGNDKRVVLFPTTSDRTSFYHELGHVLISAYDMEKKSLPGVWKHDREGAVALTGEYAGTDSAECFAEAFRFLIKNMDNQTVMARAEKLIPVTYLIFQKFLEHSEAT